MRDRTDFYGRQYMTVCQGMQTQENVTGGNVMVCHKMLRLSRSKTVFPRSPCFFLHKEGADFEFGETMEEYTRPLRVPRPGEATDRPAYDSRNRFGFAGSHSC